MLDLLKARGVKATFFVVGRNAEDHPDLVRRIVDELAPLDGELVITKQCVNPFFNTGLMTWLMQNGIKRLYLGGVATHLVVESTARFADDAGFAPVVIEDICAAPNPALHDHFITMIAPAVGTVSNTGDFVAAAAEG